MTFPDLGRWAAFALAMWLVAVFAFGCARSAHVKAVNTAAVTLETVAAELLAEYESERATVVRAARAWGEDEEEAEALSNLARRWVPVVHALSAAYAAHDAWRILVERDADDAAILIAATRARTALCELQDAAKALDFTISIGVLCGAHTRGAGRIERKTAVPA